MLELTQRLASATKELDDLIRDLPSDRREYAKRLLRSLEKQVVMGNDSLGETLQYMLLAALVGGIFGVAPIGITVVLFAYFSGLSHEVGEWMFYSAVGSWSLACGIAFITGRRAPNSP